MHSNSIFLKLAIAPFLPLSSFFSKRFALKIYLPSHPSLLHYMPSTFQGSDRKPHRACGKGPHLPSIYVIPFTFSFSQASLGHFLSFTYPSLRDPQSNYKPFIHFHQPTHFQLFSGASWRSWSRPSRLSSLSSLLPSSLAEEIMKNR